MAAVASVVKLGGTVAIFTPSRHAAYARLNALLPHKVTRKILDFVYPWGREATAFEPTMISGSIRELSALGRRNGLEVLSIHRYYSSSYFGIFFPAYLIWRLWLLLKYVIDRDSAVETFTIIFRKPLNVRKSLCGSSSSIFRASSVCVP